MSQKKLAPESLMKQVL